MPPPGLLLPVLEAFRPEFSPRTRARASHPHLRDDPGTGAEDRRRGPAADGPPRRARLQQLSPGLQPGCMVSPACRPPAALGRDGRLRPRGIRPDLRHRRDAGAAMGPQDPHPRPRSRPPGLRQGTIRLGERDPLDRPGLGRHRPLGEEALGPADPQPAQPDPQGQPQAGATPQDHRRARPPDDRLPPSLAAHGRPDGRRRFGVQRDRVGPGLPASRHVLAAVRRQCWVLLDIRTSERDPCCTETPRP